MRYRLLVLASDGRPHRLQLDAATPEAARRIAAAQNLRTVSVRRVRQWGLALGAGEKPHKLRTTPFVQEIVALLDAGLTITEAIDALLASEGDATTRVLLTNLAARMTEGRSFSAALEQAGSVFPRLLVATARSSERSGDLAAALRRYVEYAATAEDLEDSVRSSLAYPALLLAVGGAVIVFLLAFVVPKFSEVYREAGRDLPVLSRMLLAWGALARHHWELVGAAAVTMAAGVFAALRQLIRAGTLRRWLLALPALARLLRSFERIRLYRAIAMLLRAGIPLTQSLEECAQAVPPALARLIHEAADGLRVGRSLSDVLEQRVLADGIALRLLRAGERSGRLAEMLERAGSFEQQRLTRTIGVLTRIIEPLLMVVLGIVIGGIVVLMYLPIFDLAAAIE